MAENLFADLREIVLDEVVLLCPALRQDALERIEVIPARDPTHGDVATNAALIAAKALGSPPREIASALAARLMLRSQIAGAEPAGPGFVNLTLDQTVLQNQIPIILRAGAAYGASTLGCGQRINIEYVSANPTGPLHVGHCRGAVVGDALANLLSKAGYKITKEFYVNDAGAQVIALARSAYARYLTALGLDEQAATYAASVPGGLQYKGTYLSAVGEALANAHGHQFVNVPEHKWLNVFRDFAVAKMLVLIKEDLAALGVVHDVFTSERALVEAGGVRQALGRLRDRGLLYEGVLAPPKGKNPDDWEPRQQTLFRATEFGDDVDRPIQKSDGSNTYFANDVAYHANKIERGFNTMIDVWGADHGGYIKRMQAAVRALGDSNASLEVVICQIVRVVQNGEPMRMSKRAGTYVELRDLIESVGPDVVRFIMLMRKPDAQMEFDLDSAVEQTRENPVFYVQYAHARCRSVLRIAAAMPQLGQTDDEALATTDLSFLTAPEELCLIRRLAAWPRLIESAATAREPHRIGFYLYDLASDFHALWNCGHSDATLRFIQIEATNATRARLALVAATAAVIRSGLAVMGVTPVEEMR